jgi:hypothetical protein
MKKTMAIPLLLIMVGSVRAQSVVELSRLEKARRENLKGGRVKVVTNEDLTILHRAPAITVNPDSMTAMNSEPAAGVGPAPSNAGPVRTIIPNVVGNGPKLFGEADSSGAGDPGSGGSVEARLKAVQERIDLLTTKMNALWQEFYAQNTMTPQDVIQQRIDETYQKLVKAQEEEVKLKAQMETGKNKSTEKR